MSVVEVEKRKHPWSLITSVVFGLLILSIGYILLSLNHSERYRLVQIDDTVLIENGLFAPFGYHKYNQGKAYQPLKIPSHITFSPIECDDLIDCEKKFFNLILELIHYYLGSENPGSILIAKQLMIRAQLFPHINWEERERIEDFSGSINYTESMVMMEEIHEDYTAVLKKLYRAKAGVGKPRKKEVDQKIRFVEQQLEQLNAIGIGTKFTEQVITDTDPPPATDKV